MINWIADKAEWIRDQMKQRSQPLYHFRKHLDAYLVPTTVTIAKEIQQIVTDSNNRLNDEREVKHRDLQGNNLHRTAPVAIAWQVEMWNRIVVAKPYTGPVPRFADFDQETWQRACENAQRIIAAKGEEVSWLTLRWTQKAGKDNWRALADGEFNFMAVAPKPAVMSQSQRDAETVRIVREKMQARIEAAAKREKEKTNGVE